MNSWTSALRPAWALGIGVQLACAGWACRADSPEAAPAERLRLIIETDAGGDPDDEQSLVRFLLYLNEWDVEGIIANRPVSRPRENRNPERTGLGVVRRLLDAYAACRTNLAAHDPRYPTAEFLRQRTVAGYDDTDDAVRLLIAAVDRPDPRPLWYSDWGTDHGAATNNLRRALDRVLAERGPDGYARFKSRLRLSSYDAFGPHTAERWPPFPLWVDTFRPVVNGVRWYHRFSALTAKAGGFDLVRDCLTGHGPLGALYPTNTTHGQKEGDTMTFLYLVPSGLNAPDHPGWGGWGGRLGHNPEHPGRPYFWANQGDAWNGSTHRDHTLARWAAELQNDFKARLDWCVAPVDRANHPPRVQVRSDSPAFATASRRDPVVRSGDRVTWIAHAEDPDRPLTGPGQTLTHRWWIYEEAGTYRGPVELAGSDTDRVTLVAPEVHGPESLHLVVSVTDDGEPPLTRHARVPLLILPRDREVPDGHPRWGVLRDAAASPADLPAGHARDRRSVLRFEDGRPVTRAAEWPERRREIRQVWDAELGPWPPVLDRPVFEVLRSERRENLTQQRVRLQTAPEQFGEGWLLVPDGPGPFPAVLVVYYEPETSVGLNPRQALRDFALELARRGFVTLSIGTPGGDARRPDLSGAVCQPLSYHAYVAANAWQALARLPHVDSRRIGVTGHSYGGKWAMFAAALWDRFAAVAVSDPGIVFDETRPNVNYWEPWYLGLDRNASRQPGVPDPVNPRTGAYARLVAGGRDLHELHALIAPRPFLVSGGSEDPVERWEALTASVAVNDLVGKARRILMTNRPTHTPTPESNEQLYAFFELFLGGPPDARQP